MLNEGRRSLGAELRARKAIQAYSLLGCHYHQCAVRLRRNPDLELTAVFAVGDGIGNLLAVSNHVARDIGDEPPDAAQRAFFNWCKSI